MSFGPQLFWTRSAPDLVHHTGGGSQQHDDAGLKAGRQASQQQSTPQAATRPALPARQRSGRRAGSTEIVPVGPPDAPEAPGSAPPKSRPAGGEPEDDGAPSSLYLWGIGAAVLVGAVSVAGFLLGGSRSRAPRPRV